MNKFLENLKEKIEPICGKYFSKMRAPSMREKMMLAGFMWIILLTFAIGMLGDYVHFFKARKELTINLEKQEMLISSKSAVEARLNENIKKISGGEKLEGTEFLSLIEELGKNLDLSLQTGRISSKVDGPFEISQVNVNLRNAPLNKVVLFDDLISSQDGAIAVSSAKLTPASQDGNNVNVSYELTLLLLKDSKK